MANLTSVLVIGLGLGLGLGLGPGLLAQPSPAPVPAPAPVPTPTSTPTQVQVVGPITFRLEAPKGDKGDPGAKGKDGKDGIDGQSASVFVGPVTTLPAGSPATVTNTGTPRNAVLSFGIPQGVQGSAGSGPIPSPGPGPNPSPNPSGELRLRPLLSRAFPVDFPQVQGPGCSPPVDFTFGGFYWFYGYWFAMLTDGPSNGLNRPPGVFVSAVPRVQNQANVWSFALCVTGTESWTEGKNWVQLSVWPR